MSDLPAFEDTKPLTDALPAFDATQPVPDELPAFENTVDQTDYGSTGQQALAGLEGAAQGFLSKPVATYAETHLLGVDPKDIAAREEAHPIAHGVAEAAGIGAGLYTGVGELGLLGKAGEAVSAASGLEKLAETSKMAQAGSSIIKNAISWGTNAIGNDVANNLMLGTGDPNATISSYLAHAGASTILGSATDGIFNVLGKGASKGLEVLENTRIGLQMQNFLAGVAEGARQSQGLPVYADDVLSRNAAYVKGQEIYTKFLADPANIGAVLGAGLGAHPGAAAGAWIGSFIGAPIQGSVIGGTVAAKKGAQIGAYAARALLGPSGIGRFVGKDLNKAGQEYTAGVILRLMQSGTYQSATDALNYASSIAKGSKLVDNAVNSLFQGAKAAGASAGNTVTTDIQREKMKKFVENGGINQQLQNEQHSDPASQLPPGFELEQPTQNMAEGGEVIPKSLPVSNKNPEVKPDHFSTVFPEQAAGLAAVKGRVYNYLNSIRPIPDTTKLPFDTSHKNTDKERTYNKAIDLAHQPMSILDHVQKGTINPEMMQHFTAMFPELHDHLSKKITNKIVESQMKGEKPTYQVRQGLSLFLGAPMDSTFTPANIQAAQSVFQQQQANQQSQAPGKTKKGTSKLSDVSKQYETADQARASRLSKN